MATVLQPVSAEGLSHAIRTEIEHAWSSLFFHSEWNHGHREKVLRYLIGTFPSKQAVQAWLNAFVVLIDEGLSHSSQSALTDAIDEQTGAAWAQLFGVEQTDAMGVKTIVNRKPTVGNREKVLRFVIRTFKNNEQAKVWLLTMAQLVKEGLAHLPSAPESVPKSVPVQTDFPTSLSESLRQFDWTPENRDAAIQFLTKTFSTPAEAQTWLGRHALALDEGIMRRKPQSATASPSLDLDPNSIEALEMQAIDADWEYAWNLMQSEAFVSQHDGEYIAVYRKKYMGADGDEQALREQCAEECRQHGEEVNLRRFVLAFVGIIKH